jgi:hypothetical protein
MADVNPAHRLLCDFRRNVGDTPLNGRIYPMQFVALAKQLGLSDQIRNEAVHQLIAAKLIQFTPQTTQIIALTLEGIALADQLIRQSVGAQVDDPLPDTLEEIHSQLSYWEKRQFQGQPESDWWCQVQARIDALRHKERRLTPAAPIINATATGQNARVNLYSIDQSSNSTGPETGNSDGPKNTQE